MTLPLHAPELRFELLAEIAVGNTARVELCRVVGGPKGGKLCAVKRLHPHVAEDPAFLDMFQDEVWMTAALRTPHVVEVLGWGNEHGAPWFAVELVRGVSLARLMKTVFETGEMFSERMIVFIARCICDGLAAAHALRSRTGEHLGLVHRDLTAGNVLLGFAGEVKITDFGLAKAKQRATRTLTGLLKGNPQYMSPEQVKDEPLDGRSDIFAVGVLLFELFSGRRPWAPTNDFDIMRAITDDAPLDLMELRPRMDRALVRVVEQCLEKSPERRFQSAQELSQRLDAWLDAHGYREANESALGRFVRRNAMRQMRWFERATSTEQPHDAARRADADADWNEEGPTLVQRSDHAAALVQELGGSPSVIVVEATTVRQFAKSNPFDFDNLPTGKHRSGDTSDLVTVPRDLGLLVPSSSDGGAEFEGGATIPLQSEGARQFAAAFVSLGQGGSAPDSQAFAGGPPSLGPGETQLVAPLSLGSSAVAPAVSDSGTHDAPAPHESGRRSIRVIPKTLQGLGAMPIPDVLVAARAEHEAEALGGSMAEALLAAQPPPPASGPRAQSSLRLPAVPSSAPAPSVRPHATTAPIPLARRLEGMALPPQERFGGDFGQESERLATVAQRFADDARTASLLATSAATAARLARQSVALAGRGLHAEAGERLEEARRIERALLQGDPATARPLASDHLFNGLLEWGQQRVDGLRRRMNAQDFVAVSILAVAALALTVAIVASLAF